MQNTAMAIARNAGTLLRAGYSQEKQIQHKSSQIDLVTQFDLAAEQQILGALRAAFPGHRLVAEEGGENSSDSPYVWYIDPLDGTTNFAHRFPVFAVSLALYRDDAPLVGVVYDPMRDECFAAAAGMGARLLQGQTSQPLRASGIASLGQSLLATGFPYDRHSSVDNNLRQVGAFVRRAQGVRRAGAAALDLAYVAAGRLDGYWEFKLSSWDVAAGILLVGEAGGQVTQVDGGPLRLAPRLSLVASNGLIHAGMLSVLAETEQAPA